MLVMYGTYWIKKSGCMAIWYLFPLGIVKYDINACIYDIGMLREWEDHKMRVMDLYFCMIICV